MNLSALAYAALLLWLAPTGCGSDKRESGRAEPTAEPAAAAQPTNAPPPAADGEAAPRQFATAAAAVKAVLAATDARVVGFGEFHELTGSRVESALSRFRHQVAPTLVDRLSDLVVEIWARDSCGDKSATVNANVQKTTQRPASTENDVIGLMRETKARGVQNHVLSLTCADYDSIVDGKGEVDYEKMLLLVTRKLTDKTEQILGAREGDHPPATGRNLIALYGGALHNNMHPYESTAAFSYAHQVDLRSKSGFVEIDLYVPELIAGDELLSQESWYSIFEDQASADHVVLIPRGPASFILILRKGLLKKKP